MKKLLKTIAFIIGFLFIGTNVASALTIYTVPQGGSGNGSFTPNALITGGSSSTSALQQVSGLGTSGQVLVSNGTGALPSWKNASSTGAVVNAANGLSLSGSTVLLGGTLLQDTNIDTTTNGYKFQVNTSRNSPSGYLDVTKVQSGLGIITQPGGPSTTLFFDALNVNSSNATVRLNNVYTHTFGSSSTQFADSTSTYFNVSRTGIQAAAVANSSSSYFLQADSSGNITNQPLPSTLGTVTSFGFTNGSGFTGTVTNSSTTPTLALTTSLTTGSVPFIGASGALSQNNANLFWDSTNNRLGVGTSSPTTTLETLNPSNVAQFTTGYDASNNTTFETTSVGDTFEQLHSTSGAPTFNLSAYSINLQANSNIDLIGPVYTTSVLTIGYIPPATVPATLFLVPDPTGTNPNLIYSRTAAQVRSDIGAGTGSGSVSSVAFADGSTNPIYTISGSPVTTSGTLTETLTSESSNTVFAGPSSGSSAQPTFRKLTAADFPSGVGTVTGSGTSTQVAFWSSSTALTSDSNLYWDNTNKWLGLGTAVPTNSLTFGSSSTGYAAYNTSDQTTNYSRTVSQFQSGNYTMATYAGGSVSVVPSLILGVQQGIGTTTIAGIGRTLTIQPGETSTQGIFDITPTTTGSTSSAVVTIQGTGTASSSTQNWLAIQPTINQTSTAGYTALYISPQTSGTGAGVGSGTQLLIDAGTSAAANGGTHTSVFTVNNTGNIAVGGRLLVGTMSGFNAGLLLNPGTFSTSNTYSTAGFGLQIAAATYTSTGSSGTIGTTGVDTFGIPTLASSSTTTLTNAATMYIAGAPTAGSGVTINNPFSIYVNAGVSGFQRGQFGVNNYGTGVIGTTGNNLVVVANTITDTSTAVNGTVTTVAANAIGIPTYAANNSSITYTNGATFYIAGAPTAGTNVTITNRYALYVNAGNSLFNGNVNATSFSATSIQTVVNCSTSGTVTFSEPQQGSSSKQVIAYENACLGTASYTFPTPFTNIPDSLGVNAARFTSISTSATTITGVTTTGFSQLYGY